MICKYCGDRPVKPGKDYCCKRCIKNTSAIPDHDSPCDSRDNTRYRKRAGLNSQLREMRNN